MGKTYTCYSRGLAEVSSFTDEFGDSGRYVCDAHDAQSSASLKVQGEGYGWLQGTSRPPSVSPSKCLALWFCPCAQPVPLLASWAGGGGCQIGDLCPGV